MLGTHYLVDYWNCRDLTAEQWESVLRRAIDRAGAELLDFRIEQFEPQGITAFCLLSESHLAVHTWPEKDFVGIDLFTCGTQIQPELAIDVLHESLAPIRSQIRRVDRGDDVATGESPEIHTALRSGGE